MPIISFSQADKMLAVTVEASYQKMVVSEIDGPKASNSGKGINWFFKFRVNEGKYLGKEIKQAFTSASESPSLLGTLMWMPTAHMRQLYAAIKKMKADDVPDSFDTDELLNGPFDGKVELLTVEGQFVNTVSQFLPEGSTQKVPF